jgi:hypothetical protein
MDFVSGSIHLTNVVANPRIKLLYIVEEIESKALVARDVFGLGESTKLLKISKLDEVLEDTR